MPPLSLDVRERPREKLYASGPGILSDIELIALMLGSGTKQNGVLGVAAEVLLCLDRHGENISIDILSNIQGMGKAKASLFLGALELARRRIKPKGTKISGPTDVFNLLRYLGDRKQEHFVVVTLNGAHEVIAHRVATIGLVNQTQVHPREVFADAITDRAASVILAHNHPSEDLTPSEEDKAVTNRLSDVGKLLGIPVLDHLIFCSHNFISLRESGLV